MKNHIDFPALLKTLNLLDELLLNQHSPKSLLATGRYYHNVWESPDGSSPLQVMRRAQEQIFRNRDLEWFALLDERKAEDLDALREKIIERGRNTDLTMIITTPRVGRPSFVESAYLQDQDQAPWFSPRPDVDFVKEIANPDYGDVQHAWYKKEFATDLYLHIPKSEGDDKLTIHHGKKRPALGPEQKTHYKFSTELFDKELHRPISEQLNGIQPRRGELSLLFARPDSFHKSDLRSYFAIEQARKAAEKGLTYEYPFTESERLSMEMEKQIDPSYVENLIKSLEEAKKKTPLTVIDSLSEFISDNRPGQTTMPNTTKEELAEAGDADRPVFDSPEAALEAVEGSIPTVATEVYDPASDIETDESGLERELEEGEDDIPGTDGAVLMSIKLTQSQAVWDFLNGFQFQDEHYNENEGATSFDLELTGTDHDEFVTGLLDAVGLDAFASGMMPTLLGN